MRRVAGGRMGGGGRACPSSPASGCKDHGRGEAMANEPKSGAIYESIGGTLGMLLGVGLGFRAWRMASPYSTLAGICAVVVAAIIGIVLMIAFSVLGGCIRR